MKKTFLTCFLLFVVAFSSRAQKTDYPLIGAQVFVEQGQTPAQIDNWFRIMHDAGMEVCRLRLFEAYMKDGQGNWDYSLFDTTFDAAARHGVKMFVTLFPNAQGEESLAGTRFPQDERHMASVMAYIRAAVTHYKDHPALYAWVLQNEPGSRVAPVTEYYKPIFKQWRKAQPKPAYDSGGYLTADLSQDYFMRYMINDYLKRISDEVRKIDPKTPHHVNPHAIYALLPQYDFPAMAQYLNSLGASMHPAHHFYLLNRDEYLLGVAANCDIIRNGAIQNPYWITELQGGNNLYSGRDPFCPTRREIEQWLWTGIMSGAEGTIFWCLNARASVKESGEWALLTLQDELSDRMDASAQVIKTVLAHKEFFKQAEPVFDPVTLMYNHESYFVQNVQANKKPGWDARETEAPIASLLADYKALTECGLHPSICAMDLYDWKKDPAGEVIVLANMVALPSYHWDNIKNFVKRGGKLVMTSMTGFFDENDHCIAMGDHPLKEMLGANFSEYKMLGRRFDLNVAGSVMPVSHFKGLIRNYSATVLGRDDEGVLLVTNKYGQGEVVWCPSMIELGAWHADGKPLRRFMEQYAAGTLKDKAPVTFAGAHDGVVMRTLRSGGSYMSHVCNKGTKPVQLDMKAGKLTPQTLYGTAKVTASKLALAPEESVVILWR